MDADLPDVIPLLACDDIEAEHDFLVQVLAFESAGIERTRDGTVVHAEVRAGARRVWLHRADDTEKLVPPRSSGTAAGGVVVHVPDVDRVYERLRAARADVIGKPRDEAYGQREFGVRDPEGHLWWMATATHPPARR